jgi:hypothetical protein
LSAVPQVLSSVVNVLNITKFLQGKPPRTMEKADQGMTIENHTGERATFNDCTFNTYNLVNNSNIKRDLANLVRPFNSGVERIDLAPSAPDLQSVTLGVDDKDSFIPPDDDAVEVEQKLYSLELLTPNLDGKAAGWRFYDLEDDVEFSASVMDEVFLKKVADKQYNFRSGDLLQVEMTRLKKRVKQRARTERIVNRVMGYSRPE